MSTRIRNTVLGDIAELTHLYTTCFNAPPWNDRWTEEAARERLGDLLNARQSRGAVAFVGAIPVGMLLAATRALGRFASLQFGGDVRSAANAAPGHRQITTCAHRCRIRTRRNEQTLSANGARKSRCQLLCQTRLSCQPRQAGHDTRPFGVSWHRKRHRRSCGLCEPSNHGGAVLYSSLFYTHCSAVLTIPRCEPPKPVRAFAPLLAGPTIRRWDCFIARVRFILNRLWAGCGQCSSALVVHSSSIWVMRVSVMSVPATQSCSSGSGLLTPPLTSRAW